MHFNPALFCARYPPQYRLYNCLILANTQSSSILSVASGLGFPPDLSSTPEIYSKIPGKYLSARITANLMHLVDTTATSTPFDASNHTASITPSKGLVFSTA